MPSIFSSTRQKNGTQMGERGLPSYGSDEQLRKNEPTASKRSLPSGPEKRNFGSSLNSWNLLKRGWELGFEFLQLGRTSRRVSWRPITLRAAVLSCFFIVSMATVGILEYLAHRSTRDGNGGGLAFAASTDQLPTGAYFTFLLLPTIISVCYSMLWSWVDLDAKRTEPWFQLSKPEGASAEDSILLQYPSDFLGFVPLVAARRKHWAVFYAGGIMMMIIWFITPLQSAIFTTGSVTRTRGVTMWTSKSLPALELQDARLNASYLNTAYGLSWLDQKLPSYTAMTYALAPYSPIALDTDPLPSEIWSSTTEMYSTSLSCTPASYTVQTNLAYNFTNNAGCVVSDISFLATEDVDYLLLYIQYWNNAFDDWQLQSPDCGLEFQHNFLAIWANVAGKNETDPERFSNMTALFCQPSYQIQTVSAQVNASDQAIIDSGFIETVGPPRNLTEDAFNITKFEYLLGTGVSSTAQGTGDWPDIEVVEQYPRLVEYALAWPLTNTVGFAVANMNSTVDELGDPVALQEAFEGAHQVLFSSAFSTLLETSDFNSSATRNGTRQDRPAAIKFVRTFSIIVEVSLCVVAALTVLLWLTTFRRPSNMTSSPASILDVMSIIASDRNIRSEFYDDGHTTEGELARKLSKRRYRLVQAVENNCYCMRLESLSGRDVITTEISSRLSDRSAHQDFRPVRPKELRLFSGILFVLYMLGGLVTLVYLYWRSDRQNGLIRPTNNSLALSIIENLVPTIFTTLLEPFWVLLNRFLCLLQPFEELRDGKSKANTSLKLKYTSLPPQLVFWRALRAQHLILASVCVIAISTNILSVALSGLFDESSISVPVFANSTYSLTPQISSEVDLAHGLGRGNIAYADHFYVAWSNITANTSLTSWTDHKYFYVPYGLSQPPSLSIKTDHSETQVQSFQATTRGFGVEFNCTPFWDNDLFYITNDTSRGYQQLQISLNHTLPDGTILNCEEPLNGDGTTSITSRATFEVMSMFDTNNTADKTGLCDILLVSGWARLGSAVPAASAGSQNLTKGRSFDYSFMSCLPTLVTAEFNVTVDSVGRVISSNQASSFDDDIDKYFISNSSSSVLMKEFSSLIQGVLEGANLNIWHNDSFTPNWSNALLKAYNNNNGSFLDPLYPVPDLSILGPKTEAIYQQLSAIIFGLNNATGLFVLGDNSTVVSLAINTTQTRIFMSDSMFKISVILLALHSFVAIAFYLHRPRRFLPRMPSTIASIIAYVSASHALDDVMTEEQKEHNPHKYGYGRFVGVDGKTHVGIERQELVVPLTIRNPEVKRKIRLRKDPHTIENWI